jgi:hypothetical protein
MDIQSVKIDLIYWFTELQDRKVMEQLQAFKKSQSKGLSDSHKALLDERIDAFE